MEYRNLGRSGLKVSAFSLGSWVTFGNQQDIDSACETIKIAYEHGVNLFDNAEAYAGGESERIMGEALRKIGLPRYSYVITSKFFWGIHPENTVNMRNTLNRKYLMQAVDASLTRYGFDFIDVIYCHRPDPNTPIEETVRAMNDIINQGKALYWGTSEWSADEIRAAYLIAEKNHWHKAITEQPCYNLLSRDRVEKEYARLYKDIGLGLTTFSPLASGLLTGKYLNGIPSGSRASLPGYGWLKDQLGSGKYNHAIQQLRSLAEDEFATSISSLALAWVAYNPNVSSVITGASRPEQCQQNMQAVEVLRKMTAKHYEEIGKLFT